MMITKQRAASAPRQYKGKARGYWNPLSHAELIDALQLKPIIKKGPFALIWVNPNAPVVPVADEADAAEA